MAQALRYGGRNEEAAAAARTAIAIRPDLPRAHLLLGDALHRLGRKEEAVAEMQKAVDLSGDDPSIRRRVEAYLPKKPQQSSR